jgi:glycosyltransferase involved in cell wall biosynthesis
MRIGLIAPPWLPVPPPAYGGTEAVVDNLARGLVQLGHDVQLFTIGASTTPVERSWFYDRYDGQIGQSVPEAAHVLAAYDALGDVDVIHDHTVLGPLVAGAQRRGGPPVVVTNHGPFTSETVPIFRRIAEHAAIVAVSHDHARRAGPVPVTAVIHHGIDLETYQPGLGTGGYLAFVGRMAPEKGVHRAIRIARAAGWPIRVVSKMREPSERAYFEDVVRPLLRPGDEPPEELCLRERLAVLQDAVALVNPRS